MAFSNLCSVIRPSPNKSSRYGTKIDTVTIHVVDGNLRVDQILGLPRFTKYDPKHGASCNYCIDSAGCIGGCVDESERSWCSSSRANDMRAVTIEVANDGGRETGYHVSGKAIESLIRLLVDICKRNGIKELRWAGDDKTHAGKPEVSNMTLHRWFSAKACPGDYLVSMHPYIAQEVNKRMNPDVNKPSDWAAASWAKVCDAGIMDGTNPQQPLTREQAACIIDRLGLV